MQIYTPSWMFESVLNTLYLDWPANVLRSCLGKARKSRDSLPLFFLIQCNTHSPCRTTSTIERNGKHHNFFIWVTILGHVLVQSVDKIHVLVVTVQLIWLLFLKTFSFNLVPTPNKYFRFARFRRSYVNHAAVVSTNHCQSYTAFLHDVHCLK